MIAVDTNVLAAAFREESPEHDRGLAAMARLAGEPRWGLPWIVVAEFYAFATQPRLWRTPQASKALGALDRWISMPGARLIGETPDIWPRLRGMLADSRARGRQVHDARIAAVCLANGVSELWTADRDFGRFPALRTRNPLVG
ncbi:MAG: TA system VapC family ribonuclease toxin [Solirubrobacteraceae bacterium]